MNEKFTVGKVCLNAPQLKEMATNLSKNAGQLEATLNAHQMDDQLHSSSIGRATFSKYAINFLSQRTDVNGLLAKERSGQEVWDTAAKSPRRLDNLVYLLYLPLQPSEGYSQRRR